MNEPEQSTLEFFGRLVADTTHQLNNRISTTDQIAGLLEDMLQASAQGVALDPQRMTGIKDRILAQMSGAADLLENLNRFAHTVECPGRTELELGELLRRFIPLCAHLAARSRVVLQVEAPVGEARCRMNPIALQQAVYAMVKVLAESVPSGADLVVRAVGAPDGAVVEFELPDASAPAELSREFLASRLDRFADDISCDLQRRGDRVIAALVLDGGDN